MTRRRISDWRMRLADRAVLRPSTAAIDAGEQHRVVLSAGPFGQLETFVHATQTPAPACDQDLDQAHPPAPELLILKLPGTGGRAERSSQLPANFLEHLRCEIWTWNPPGYGSSAGVASMATLPEAVLAFFDTVVARRRGDGTQVWVMGNSLGCVYALLLASRRPVQGLILRNPPPLVQTIAHVAVRDRPRWTHGLLRHPARWLGGGVPPELDALHTAAACSAPALFIQCEHDNLVPPALQALVREQYAGPHKLIEWEGLQHDEGPEQTHLEQMREGVAWLLSKTNPMLRQI